MAFSLPALLLAISSLFSLATSQLTDAATLGASIKYEAGYSLLPGCINQCVWDINDNDVRKIGGDLAIHLSCSDPWINGCYCRGASAAFAYSFLTQCFSYLCTTPAPNDIDSGISVYTSYCSQALGAAYSPNAIPEPAPAGGFSSVAVTSATALGVPSSRPTSTLPQQTGQPDPDSVSSTDTDSKSEKEDNKIMGLSIGAFIGVVVSICCSVLGLLFGVGFKIYKHRKHTRLVQQQQPSLTTLSYQPKA